MARVAISTPILCQSYKLPRSSAVFPTDRAAQNISPKLRIPSPAVARVDALTGVSRFLTGVNMSKTRAPPSGANPSNLVEQRIDTEDDVLHIQVCVPPSTRKFSPLLAA